MLTKILFYIKLLFNNHSKQSTSRCGKISIGRFTYGARSIRILSWNKETKLSIGSFCSIAKNVTIFLDGNHRIDFISTFPFGTKFTRKNLSQLPTIKSSSKGDVRIGSDVWIGDGATILSGVTVHHGSVIGAKSVVTKDVLPYQIVAGNPARVIGKRFSDEIIEELLQLAWWELPLNEIEQISPLLAKTTDLIQLRSLMNSLIK